MGILEYARGCRALRCATTMLVCSVLFSGALVCANAIPVRLMRPQLIESAAQLKMEGQYPMVGGGSFLAAR